ncbi:MAG: ABC transporter substrate-binding protein [Parahaliea sp.]
MPQQVLQALICGLFVLVAANMQVLAEQVESLHNHDIRVASPWPAQNTIIAMLGYGHQIVGTSLIAKRIPLFRQSVTGIEKVPVVSVNSAYELNAEQIISLGTDLLFIPQGNMSVGQPNVLARAGVRVIALEANSMQALVERVAKTGAILGPDASEKAQAWRDYFDHNVARVQERLHDLPDNERIRVYHGMSNPLMSSGRPSLNQDWMDLGGAVNIAESWFGQKKSGSGEIAIEQVVAANPQVIVLMNPRDVQNILSSPQWASVDAVIHRRVYANPQGMFWWCRESSEEALQFLWLAKTLYPDRFADIDMRAETRYFYQTFFGITLSDTQVSDILGPS